VSAVAATRVAAGIPALLRRNLTGAIGGAIVLVFAAVAVLAPVLAPYGAIQSFADAVLQPPGGRFLLGTDGNGMDVLSRTLFGARYAFGIMGAVVGFSLVFGVPIGLYAGFRGGWLDEVMLRLMDTVRVFPTIVLAIALVAASGQTLANVIIVIGVLDIPVYARMVRAEVLALRRGGLVEAAVNGGNPEWRILLVHLLPNCLRGTMAQIPIRMAWAVRVSATLAFIGLGIRVPAPEWGAMIRQGAEYMISGNWWVAMVPGAALVVLIIGFSMLGDWLEEVTDVRRSRNVR
jgi:peptide/nickel transport system permease protein